MSLDVYLRYPDARVPYTRGSGIYIRDGGETKEISVEEWNERNADRAVEVMPCEKEDEELFTDEAYSANITHNLTSMADAAGLYKACWHPYDIGIKRAGDLAPVLREGLVKLLKDPAKYKKFNPENGWGDYELLVRFVTDYAIACEEHPDAEIKICT